jgi:hypothetical protein
LPSKFGGVIAVTKDQQFLRAVESAGFPLTQFNHASHIRLAWLYLCQKPLPEAMICFRDTLQHYAAKNGKAEIYNETITFMFILLIHQQIHYGPATDGTWDAFMQANQQFIDSGRHLLMNWYTEKTLMSQEAKQVLRLPEVWLNLTPSMK